MQITLNMDTSNILINKIILWILQGFVALKMIKVMKDFIFLNEWVNDFLTKSRTNFIKISL